MPTLRTLSETLTGGAGEVVHREMLHLASCHVLQNTNVHQDQEENLFLLQCLFLSTCQQPLLTTLAILPADKGEIISRAMKGTFRAERQEIDN